MITDTNGGSMRRLSGSRSIFEEGDRAFLSGDFDRARSLLEIVSHDLEYREQAMHTLFKIYIKLGMYRTVREGLENNELKDENHRISLYAFLDNYEYNYDRSLYGYNYLINNGLKEYLFNRAVVHMNLGELSKAFDDIQETLLYKEERMKKQFLLIRIYMLEGKFDKALNILDTINRKNLSRENKKIYDKLRMIVLYNLGRDIKSFQDNDNTNFIRSILMENVNSLNSVISKMYMEDVCFDRNISVSSLVEEAKRLMSEVNPSSLTSLNVYKGKVDHSIGFSEGREINGISVSTIITTDKIASVLPVDFSSDFDIEGYSKSYK